MVHELGVEFAVVAVVDFLGHEPVEERAGFRDELARIDGERGLGG